MERIQIFGCRSRLSKLSTIFFRSRAQKSSVSFLDKTMSMYKHLFVDLDNTIWDFEANSEAALNEVFLTNRLDKIFTNFSVFFSLYSVRNRELWSDYANKKISKQTLNKERFNYPLNQIGLFDEHLAEKIGKEYLKLCPTKTILMPHARDLLNYLVARYQLHILSNGFVEVQYTKLKHAELEHYFGKIFLSEEIGALKPHKRIFEYALKSVNARKNEALMIGDNFEADIVGAKNAGIDQLFYKVNDEQIESFTPTFTVRSLSEIKNIL